MIVGDKPDMKMIIDGGKNGGDGIEIHSPIDGQVIATVPRATKTDVEFAVNSAQKSSPAMKELPIAIKQEILLKISKKITENADKLAETITIEQGKPKKEAYIEVDYVSKIFKVTAHTLSELNGRCVESMLEPENKYILERYEPYGVVGIITPFNFPLLLPANSIAPALGAGNSVVFKPSEVAPLSGLLLSEIINSITVNDPFLGENRLPKGALNVITGDSKTGELLVKNRNVDMICFTGSAGAGKKIYEGIGSTVNDSASPKRLLLELGGNGPVIVFEDSDLERAVDCVAYGSFTYCGEVCLSTQRVYVEESIYREFLDRLVKAANERKCGNPMDDKTDVGPIISDAHRNKITGVIEDAQQKGGNVLCGGREGVYIKPVVISDITRDMLISNEEIFGPVVGVSVFKTIEGAINLANSTEQGLSAAVFTRDMSKAMKVVKEVNAGTVVINDTNQWFEPHVAFGGYKWSGTGRQGGIHSLKEFSQIKTIVVDHS